MARIYTLHLPESSSSGDEEAALVELPDAVVLDGVAVPHRQREVVPPRLRVPTPITFKNGSNLRHNK